MGPPVSRSAPIRRGPPACVCEHKDKGGPAGLPCRAPCCSLAALGRLFSFRCRPELGLLAASFTS